MEAKIFSTQKKANMKKQISISIIIFICFIFLQGCYSTNIIDFQSKEFDTNIPRAILYIILWLFSLIIFYMGTPLILFNKLSKNYELGDDVVNFYLNSTIVLALLGIFFISFNKVLTSFSTFLLNISWYHRILLMIGICLTLGLIKAIVSVEKTYEFKEKLKIKEVNREKARVKRELVKKRSKKRRNNLITIMSSNLNLNSIDMNGADLHDLDFKEKELVNANLEDTNLENANLSGANLENANLENSILVNSILINTNLRSGNLSGANLSGAVMERINLENATMVGSNLEGAKLENANLSGANLENVNFKYSNLVNSVLIKANLSGANLIGAKLEGINLENADMKGINLEGAKLVNYSLKKARLENANLEKVDFENVDLSNAVLTRASLKNAKLKNVNLSNAHISLFKWNGVDLTTVNLDGAVIFSKEWKEYWGPKDELEKINLLLEKLNISNDYYVEIEEREIKKYGCLDPDYNSSFETYITGLYLYILRDVTRTKKSTTTK